MANKVTGTLAILIDGDNASPKIISGLLAEIANYGVASVSAILRGCASRAPRSMALASARRHARSSRLATSSFILMSWVARRRTSSQRRQCLR